MRCEVCGGASVAIVVHGAAGEGTPLPGRGFCEAHAPARLALGDSPARAAVVEGALHANPGSAAALYDAAAARLRAGEVTDALALALRAIADDPARVLPRELLSRAREQADDLGGALEAAREATACVAADGETWALVGRLRACLDDAAGALEAFETGAALDPWDFECVRRASVLRMAAGAFEVARALLARFLEETGRRSGEVIPVAVNVGPDAVPGAPPPATVVSFSSELAYRETLRREGRRRSHIVAARRYEAGILTAHALVGLGRRDDAVAAVESAQREVEGVSRLLLMEAGLDPEE